MVVSFFLYCILCLLAAAASVLGQAQSGYISIDCGSQAKLNYIDTDTGISYASDGATVSTGTNRNISSEYAYPKVPNLPFPLSDLRSFPQGNKNCYTLQPADGKDNLYLIRASFLYGNYDGQNKPPEFDLYLNLNFWATVKFRNVSETVVREVISFADSDTVRVCLINKGLGTPFISALELRPLNNSIYGTEFGRNASLILYRRYDTGYLNGTGRYKDDIFDRVWSPYTSASWDSVKQSVPINNYEDAYRPPMDVIKTAATPTSDDDPLELYWTSEDPNAKFYAFLHFAELDNLKKSETRRLKVFWNGSPVSGIFSPIFLYATTISNSRAFTGKEHWISIQKTAASTLPPILNAIEIYTIQNLVQLPTAKEDVDVIENVRSMYGIKKIWSGDPCTPKNYPWEGLGCSYNSFPRIISLNLSSSGLSGLIANSIGNLSLLESLDLSNNNLHGPFPEFLNDLVHLKFLILKGNNFSGFLPRSLMRRTRVGTLHLSVDDQNLCHSGSCQDKKNKVIPAIIAASVVGLLLVLVVFWVLRRQRKSQSYSKPLLATNKRKFSSSEVSKITSNFQKVIGKGGFGTVYLGSLEDGIEVAVKMINASPETSRGGSSSRGSKEFQVEAELLLTVHHRNLASFVGYCDDGLDMALIYEYMANGNLQDYLSSPKAENLSWEMRLRIAIDSAQGLEYLHFGCKPPIVHRDVKTANILLSENMDAKIADFGLSKVFPDDDYTHVVTAVMGTPGYVDPEYYNSYKLNEKSDVYSFGVVLMELITGQRAIMKTEDEDKINVIHWVEQFLETGDINGAVDRRLNGEFNQNSAWKFLELSMSCITERGSNRPTMGDVLAELKQCLAMEMSGSQELINKNKKESYGELEYEVSPESLTSMGCQNFPIAGPIAR